MRPRPYGPRQKNGLALAGHGAEAVGDAIARSIQDLPEHLRKSLTWDQGAEMAQHEKLKSQAGIDIYFCDRQSPTRQIWLCQIACRAVHGNAGAMKIQTAFCGNTSLKAQTLASTVEMNWTRWHIPSTADPAKLSDGKHRPKHSTKTKHEI